MSHFVWCTEDLHKNGVCTLMYFTEHVDTFKNQGGSDGLFTHR